MRAYLFNLHPCGGGQSRPRRAGLICLAIFLAVLSLSCRSKSPDQSGEDGSDPNVSAETEANDIAVTVNGVDIAESKIERLIKPQLERIAKQAAQLPPAFAEQYREQLRREILEQLIREQLLEEKVMEANIVVTEEEVSSKITEIASVQRPPLSLEDFKKKIEEYGLTFDDVKEDVRRGLSRDRFMAGQWAGKIDVTADDAKKYYDEYPKQFETPEQVRASHILIEPNYADPNADPNEAKAEARAKIEEMLKQINEGSDFAELAKANSACLSAEGGGDLGFFPRGRTTQSFEKVAFELEVGQLSDVVETEYGYHIIKVADHKDAGVVPFEQAKDDITEQLTEQKKQEFVNEYVESLKAKATIVYPPGKEPSSAINQP
jgi:peptidyl-prolyl cis-trans isomerase C